MTLVLHSGWMARLIRSSTVRSLAFADVVWFHLDLSWEVAKLQGSKVGHFQASRCMLGHGDAL